MDGRKLGARQFSLLHLMLALTLLAVASAAYTEGWFATLPPTAVLLIRYGASGGVIAIACCLGSWCVLPRPQLTARRSWLAIACCVGLGVGLEAAMRLLDTLPTGIVWASALATAVTVAFARFGPRPAVETAR